MDLKNILKEANAFIAAGDYERFLTYCSANSLWTFVGDRTVEGVDEVRDYMKETYIKPPRFKVESQIKSSSKLRWIF